MIKYYIYVTSKCDLMVHPIIFASFFMIIDLWTSRLPLFTSTGAKNTMIIFILKMHIQPYCVFLRSVFVMSFLMYIGVVGFFFNFFFTHLKGCRSLL